MLISAERNGVSREGAILSDGDDTVGLRAVEVFEGNPVLAFDEVGANELTTDRGAAPGVHTLRLGKSSDAGFPN